MQKPGRIHRTWEMADDLEDSFASHELEDDELTSPDEADHEPTLSQKTKGKKRARSANRNWAYLNTFPTLEMALEYCKLLGLLWHGENGDGFIREPVSANGKRLETHLVRRTPINPKKDKHGRKKHRFACDMHKTHQCKVQVLIQEEETEVHHDDRNVTTETQFSLHIEPGQVHDHSNYCGNQVGYDMKKRAEQLCELKPSQLRRQLTKEGFKMDTKAFEQARGVRYRALMRMYGDPSMVNTVASLDRLCKLHSMDWDDEIHLRESDENGYFFSLVKQVRFYSGNFLWIEI